MNTNNLKVLAGAAEQLDLFNANGYDSLNLWREVTALAPKQIKRTRQGLHWVRENNLTESAVIVGGTAVAHHCGLPRPLTPDLDFIVADPPQITRLLSGQVIEHRPLAFVDGSHVGITVPAFDADFMVTRNRRLNDMIVSTSVPGRFGGGTFRFISPEMLAVQKFLTGRDKDLGDGFKLTRSMSPAVMQRFKNLAATLRKAKLIKGDQYDDLQAFMW
jgi:hypothetical protein